MRHEAVYEAARLLNTSPKHIALVESTTHGLNIAANSIELHRGDNIVIADTEFLQVAIPWSKKTETLGIEIKPLRSHDSGSLTMQDFEQAVDASTKVVVPWPSFAKVQFKHRG